MNSTEASTATDGNLIVADFSPECRREVRRMIKTDGFAMTEVWMLHALGMHPSFVKAVIRNVMRRSGW